MLTQAIERGIINKLSDDSKVF